jgi:hypothetical protein
MLGLSHEVVRPRLADRVLPGTGDGLDVALIDEALFALPEVLDVRTGGSAGPAGGTVCWSTSLPSARKMALTRREAAPPMLLR